MKILALDFSCEQRSVAVLTTGRDTHQVMSVTEVVESSSSAGPLAMIEQALHQAQIEREQIEVIAVGLGPGSYTGIRASLALAQGWHLARSVRLVGAASSEAIAAQARIEGVRGPVSVVIDAQRNEFYLAGFDLSDGAQVCTDPLHLATLEQVGAEQAKGRLLIGPEVTKWFEKGQTFLARAGTVGRLATEQGESGSQTLEPIYLREVSFVKAPPSRPLPQD